MKRATKHFKTDDLIEYIDISSIDRLAHRISSTNLYILAEAPSRAQQCVEYNDVLVSLVRPNLKNVAIINDDRSNLVASSGFCVLRGKTLIPKFVYYIATSSFFTLKLVSKCAGAAYPAVNDEDIRNILIPRPSKTTQEKIVRELDKINEIISDCKEAIRNLDNLAQSIFYDYFGDPFVIKAGFKSRILDDICTVTSSNRIFADEYCENGIPFYRGKEISELSRGENISIELFISEERYQLLKSSNNIPQLNDILITAVGTIGNIWIVNSIKPFYFKDGNIIWLRNMDFTIINTIYFKFFLTNLIQNEKEKMANGSAYKALTIQTLKKASVNIPPLELQEKFAVRIEQILQQKKGLEETIANMQTLLDSRMDYWFN